MNAKKNHQIRARDAKGQPREVKGYGTWKPWRSPADWTAARIAGLEHRPGVYMVRAITAPQTPVEFSVVMSGGGATPEELKKRATPLQGVIYIGKAVDLTNRFGTLAFSWQSNPPVGAHTSARNYLRKDAAFRQQFPADKIELRCMPIGTKDWTDKALAEGLLDISQNWFWQHYPHWTQGHGNSDMDQTCAATISAEQSLLCLYYKVFGDFPPLNIRQPNMIGAKLDDAWLAKLNMLGMDPAEDDPAADAAVEMLDAGGAEAKAIIEKHRQGHRPK